MPESRSGLKLDLADGQRWFIRPVDDKAAAVVDGLGKAMQLRPGSRSGRQGDAVRELCVAKCDESGELVREAGSAVVCHVQESTNPSLLGFAMARVASTIGRESLLRSGLLLHGALGEYHGSGFIMAGPSGIGKSTASARLPPPWRSLCDDATLVVKDGKGRFWAHPWPTWSRFFFDGPGGSWPVEQAVPLKSVFFLAQSPSEKLEQVNATQAAALTLESAKVLALSPYGMTAEEATSVLCTDGVKAAWGLALSVPAYSLKLNLDGRFWELIEHVLPTGDAAEAPAGETKDEEQTTAVTIGAHDALRLVYTGTSMSPTFQARDLLEIRPYGRRRVHPGDIVSFRSPEADMTVVHRVVAVERRRTEDGRPKDGIRTRGDNNRQTDAWVLQPEDIVGRVAAVQRGAWRRTVPGAWRGFMVLGLVRLGRSIRKRIGLLPHVVYRLAVGLGPFDYLLPRSRRPRVVRFDARYQVLLKLLSGSQPVGQWSDRLEEWRIRRPFHLFVDEQSLPCPK